MYATYNSDKKLHATLHPKNYSIVHDFSYLILSLFYVILI